MTSVWIGLRNNRPKAKRRTATETLARRASPCCVLLPCFRVGEYYDLMEYPDTIVWVYPTVIVVSKPEASVSVMGFPPTYA